LVKLIKSFYIQNIFIIIITFFAIYISNYADEYSYKPLILISFIIFGVFLLIYFFENNVNISYLIILIIFSLVLYAYSGLPGREFISINNFVVLSILYCILSIIFSYKSNNLRFCQNSLEFILLLLFSFFFLISIFLYNFKDIQQIDGVFKVFTFILSGAFLCNFVPKLLLTDIKYLDYFFKALVYLGILCGIMGFVSMFFTINPYSQMYIAVSIFTHPNATASLYNFTIPPTLYYLFFKKNSLNDIEKIIFSSGLLIQIVALLFTFNRTGIISIAVVFIIMTYYYSKKALLFVLFMLPIASAFFFSNIVTVKGAGTIFGRIGLLYTAYEMIRSSTTGLLWGFGTISTMKIIETVKLSLGVNDANNNPHNIFLFFILQFGLVCAAPLFTYFLIVLIRTIKNLFSNKQNRILLMCACVCFSLIFKNSFEDEIMFVQYYQYHFFMLFLGLIIILTNKKNSFLIEKMS